MISHVSGLVTEKRRESGSLIIDVGGLGYEVSVTSIDFESAAENDILKLYTYHHIREQSQELFGFSQLAAKKLFELLITVQGVGPKAGLAILSLGDSEVVRNAIASGDSGFITKASGVGKRIAERVVVDLVDKVGLAVYRSNGIEALPALTTQKDEAIETLMALGYAEADAIEALHDIRVDLPTAQRVTAALKTHANETK